MSAIRFRGPMGTNSLRQSEHDADRGSNVDGLPVPLRGLEAHALHGARRRFIEAMAEATDNAQHVDLTGRGEFHFEHHVSFDLKLPRFVAVDRSRLRQYFERYFGRRLTSHLWRR